MSNKAKSKMSVPDRVQIVSPKELETKIGLDENRVNRATKSYQTIHNSMPNNLYLDWIQNINVSEIVAVQELIESLVISANPMKNEEKCFYKVEIKRVSNVYKDRLGNVLYLELQGLKAEAATANTNLTLVCNSGITLSENKINLKTMNKIKEGGILLPVREPWASQGWDVQKLGSCYSIREPLMDSLNFKNRHNHKFWDKAAIVSDFPEYAIELLKQVVSIAKDAREITSPLLSSHSSLSSLSLPIWKGTSYFEYDLWDVIFYFKKNRHNNRILSIKEIDSLRFLSSKCNGWWSVINNSTTHEDELCFLTIEDWQNVYEISQSLPF